MDASDVLRKIQAKTIFNYYSTTLNSQAACASAIAACSSLTVCSVLQYPTYEIRQQVNLGAKIVNGCSNSTICGCS